MLKRFALLFALLPTLMRAQSTTPNIGLQIPATGSNNWYIPLNFDFSRLDLYLSGNAPIPALSVTGNVTIGGTLTAGQITGTGGSIFATAASAGQYSPVYYSQSPNGTAFAGVAPFTGFAYYRGNGPPRVASQADLNTLIGGAACGTAGTAYSPQAGNCITVGSGAVASSAQYSIPFFSATGTSNALAGASGLSTNSAGDSLTATNTITSNIVIGTAILGGGALSISGTSFTSGSFSSSNAAGTGISLGGSATGVHTWQMNSLANNHLQFLDSTAGGGAAFDLSPTGVATATSFVGSGATLTALNASNITTGTLAAARVPTLAVTGGTINGTSIGATTPSTGAFTSLTSTGITSTSTAQLNAIFTSPSTTGTAISIRGTGTGVADWRILSDSAGDLEFNVGTTNEMFITSAGVLTPQSISMSSGNISAGTGQIFGGTIASNGDVTAGNGAISLTKGSGGVNALCLTVSSGCNTTNPATFNGLSVDTVNAPNRLEINAVSTIQFFVNNGVGGLGPSIKSDGTFEVNQPLSLAASGLATSTAVANRSYPIVVQGVTMYMLLSTTP